jgi:hypothetical protein
MILAHLGRVKISMLFLVASQVMEYKSAKFPKCLFVFMGPG